MLPGPHLCSALRKSLLVGPPPGQINVLVAKESSPGSRVLSQAYAQASCEVKARLLKVFVFLMDAEIGVS